jgi:DNA polymerase-3 subunit chi
LTQVDFYQLGHDPVEKAVAGIAENVLRNGGRLLVVADDPDRRERISAALWSAGPESWLANDQADAPLPQVQPILLSGSCDAANAARYIALADGHWREAALAFDRAFYLFDDATLDEARAAWRALSRNEAVKPRFWRQEGGKWRAGP